MDSDFQLTYSANLQSTCLCAVRQTQVNGSDSSFLVGTSCPNSTYNQLHFVRFDLDRFKVSSQKFNIKGQVIQAQSCPTDQSLALVNTKEIDSSGKRKLGTSLVQLNDMNLQSGNKSSDTNLKVSTLLTAEKSYIKILWTSEVNNTEKIVAISNDSVDILSLNSTLTNLAVSSSFQLTEATKVVELNCHNEQVHLTTTNSIIGYDLRQANSKPNYLLHTDAEGLQLCGDVNYNLTHQFVVGDKYGRVRYYDLRKPDTHVFAYTPHNHWVYTVKFHPRYDHLLLSTSSDKSLQVHAVDFLAANPPIPPPPKLRSPTSPDQVEENVQELKESNRLIQLVDKYPETSYQALWCMDNPWYFFNLGWDGTLSLNQLEDRERYRILL